MQGTKSLLRLNFAEATDVTGASAPNESAALMNLFRNVFLLSILCNEPDASSLDRLPCKSKAPLSTKYMDVNESVYSQWIPYNCHYSPFTYSA